MSQFETMPSDYSIGPYHPVLPGPFKLKLQLDGDVIAGCETETGFLHRGLEKSFELHKWNQVIVLADRVDPESTVFGELVFCLAFEEICDVKVQGRAQQVRLILSELARVSSHLKALAAMAMIAGVETAVHYMLRERERILDLNELVSGVRFSLNFLRIGGMASDVSDGFIERVLEVTEQVEKRLREFDKVLGNNSVFRARTSGLGVLPAEQALALAVSGPNARATGLDFDVRRLNAYCGFDRVNFKVITEKAGDCYSRFRVRFEEIRQSLWVVRRLAESFSADGGGIAMTDMNGFIPPAGEAFATVESPRGLLGCYVVSDGRDRPCRVQFRTPTVAALSAIPTVVQGESIEDLGLILASLDLGIAEADR